MPEARILGAARQVLAEHGYAGMTLERIAEAAGMSRMTLHRRGFSGEEIFQALVAETIEDYLKALLPALTAPGDGAERLEMAAEAICREAERNLDLMLAIHAETDAAYHGGRGLAGIPRRPGNDPLERITRDGIADGTLRESDPEETAALLTNWVGWTYVHLRTASGWSERRAREAVVRRSMDALRA